MSPLIIVILLSVVISILLAVVISVASIVFHVEEDPRLQDIIEMLPNQNCGLCGNPGCKAMAESLLRSDSKLTQCKPGDQDMRDAIKEYLETHPDENGEFVKVKM